MPSPPKSRGLLDPLLVADVAGPAGQDDEGLVVGLGHGALGEDLVLAQDGAPQGLDLDVGKGLANAAVATSAKGKVVVPATLGLVVAGGVGGGGGGLKPVGVELLGLGVVLLDVVGGGRGDGNVVAGGDDVVAVLDVLLDHPHDLDEGRGDPQGLLEHLVHVGQGPDLLVGELGVGAKDLELLSPQFVPRDRAVE